MRRNYSRSILLFWYPPSHSCGSTSGPAWYPSCPVISGKLPSSGLLHYLWFQSVCVGHLSALFTASRHFFYSTESIFYFFAACPICPAKVSHFHRPTLAKNIHKTRRLTSFSQKASSPPCFLLNSCYENRSTLC